MPMRMSDTEGIAEPCRSFHSALCIRKKHQIKKRKIPGMDVNEREFVCVEEIFVGSLQANHARAHVASHQLVQQVAVVAREWLPGLAVAADFPLNEFDWSVGIRRS